MYYYKKDRGQENVNDILGDYCGVIQSDGYQVYSKFSSAEGHAGCLSHARRKFEDALKSNEALYKQITRKGTAEEEKEKLLDENPSFAKTLWFVKQFDRIFKIEKKAKQTKHSLYRSSLQS